MQVKCNTPLESLKGSYEFAWNLIPTEGLNKELWTPKVLKVQIRTISTHLLGSPKLKCTQRWLVLLPKLFPPTSHEGSWCFLKNMRDLGVFFFSFLMLFLFQIVVSFPPKFLEVFVVVVWIRLLLLFFGKNRLKNLFILTKLSLKTSCIGSLAIIPNKNLANQLATFL